MGKVRLIAAFALLIILFVFALFNGGEKHVTDIQFFLSKWTVTNVPAWGVIYLSLVLGVLIGYMLRGGRKPRGQ
jgi:uncharacterized integral membrane protein